MLPYDIKLRAPKVRKHKLQSFPAATAESYGSGTSSGSKQSWGSVSRLDDLHSTKQKEGSGSRRGEEVTSPLKARGADGWLSG